MNHKEFPEANKTLTKPEGWTDEECSPLRVYSDGQECISLWRPTLRERLSILFFGAVWLRVWSGQTQAPVCLTGMRTIFVGPGADAERENSTFRARLSRLLEKTRSIKPSAALQALRCNLHPFTLPACFKRLKSKISQSLS